MYQPFAVPYNNVSYKAFNVRQFYGRPCLIIDIMYMMKEGGT